LTCARSCSRRVFTYLELDGVLRQGTPFFAGYRLRPLGGAPLEDVFGIFDEARAGFLRRLIATGKTGRTWTTIAPDDSAAMLGEERRRILAALEYLDEKGLIELQRDDVRQRDTVLARRRKPPIETGLDATRSARLRTPS